MNTAPIETLIKEIATETARTPPLDGAPAHLRAALDLITQHNAIQANPETAVKAPVAPAQPTTT